MTLYLGNNELSQKIMLNGVQMPLMNESIPLMEFDKIVKTNEKYILVNGEYIKESESHNAVAINNRLKEYPPLAEQLDMIYHDLEDGTNNWQTLIKSIKEKYPKE